MLLKLPVPLVLHTRTESLATLAPLSVYTGLLAHTFTLLPALAVATGLIVSVMLLVICVQGFLGIDVNVNVTVPAVISAALGVYVGFKVVVLLKLPVPLVLHDSRLSVAVALDKV